MQTIHFPEANVFFVPAPGDEANVSSMSAWSDGREVISFWRFSEEELVQVAKTGGVYVRLLCDRPPPQLIQVENPFSNAPVSP